LPFMVNRIVPVRSRRGHRMQSVEWHIGAPKTPSLTVAICDEEASIHGQSRNYGFCVQTKMLNQVGRKSYAGSK
jgi:hypothetical protein